MRLALVLCLACAGCDLLFQLDHVPLPGDGAVGGSDGSGGGSDVPNLVFVTSQKVAPASLGGVAAGDALCNSLAHAAGHPEHYVAWLSSSAASATARIGTTARGWVRADGKPFADTLVDIAQDRVWYPLRLTESGDDVTSSGLDSDLVVATGTDQNGAASINTCDDYTNPAKGIESGLADDSPYGWGWYMGDGCNMPARLYCFGVDHSAPVALTPESTRHAFVSVNDLTSGGGVAGFDADCASEAAMAQLPGTYHAAVATTSQPALGRFTTGVPWVRADGVTVIDANGALVAPIELNAGGGIEGSTVAWCGASSLITKAPGSAASCFDWTRTDTTQGLTGNITRSGTEAFGGIPNNCNIAIRVYCLQD